ncbi:hypothetical protein NXS98_00035 [Fontisphaera persica]|uniref:hypothetical protein n=1 Tax=Fontisphaera persica TaxID=2974023 RepID=UPI0024BF4FC8|nr:hypothetical protein [Fontisphaera persica]WCJ59542.1 hypothetical protein NXS98_00035 [Fontisphaera persica]
MRIEDLFLKSAAVILAVTAMCKLISVAGEAKVMALADPVFRFISLRQLLLVTALAEGAVAWYVWKGKESAAKSFLVLWLCGMFIGYRLGLWLMNYKGCSCVGTVTEWLPVPPATVDWVMKVVLAYLTAGSAVCFWKTFLKGDTKQTVGHQPAG